MEIVHKSTKEQMFERLGRLRKEREKFIAQRAEADLRIEELNNFIEPLAVAVSLWEAPLYKDVQ